MSGEKSRIVKVYASCEFEYFDTDSVLDAENRAIEDAQEELSSIYAGKWSVDLAEYQRDREY